MWDELPQGIKDELIDPRFTTRQHYSRSTYALGCHGPLCQKAERDRGRRRNKQRGGEKYEPKHSWRVSDLPNIEAIIEWHLKDLAERRALAKKAS